jgi:hypothetical protein
MLFVPGSSHGAFPGFGPEHVGGNPVAVKLSANDVTVMGEKFVRVSLWDLRSYQFVEPDRKIGTHVVHIQNVSEVERLVRGGDAVEIAPGVHITLRTPPDDPRTHLCLFELWGRLKLFASVMPSTSAVSQ